MNRILLSQSFANKHLSQRNQITLQDFFTDKNILHSDSSEYTQTIQFLLQNNADIVTYNVSKTFAVQNISILQIDKDNNYFYEFSPLSRQNDIVDNITVESPGSQIKISYLLNDEPYSTDEIKKFLIASAPYCEFKIRFTFQNNFKPDNNYIFTLFMRYYIVNNDLRKNILLSKDIIVDKIIYKGGTCYRLNN